ncbi:radical SAM/SPASM domain-containing protein [Metaclostridioides mangenotii]|uniref:radical SAM/SPASM domain-containing protein n=1 Tax=Metaclostridioides mangenotii TaxID=1540 RepID=UPI0026EC901B|nr:radical SAM protein [Clostridioides mangenotii]
MNINEVIKMNKDDLLIKCKENLVIIYNKELSGYMKISREVYNYYVSSEIENLTINEFLDLFEDEEDKYYIEQITEKMIKLGILSRSDYANYIKYMNAKNMGVYLCITNKCNLKCKHCCTNCSPENDDYLSIHKLKSIVDIVSKLSPKYIVITGGEPLIRNDFNELISYIRIKIPNIYLVLSTNGTLIANNNIEFIVKRFNKIDISLDGVDEETCSKIRGKGVFTKAVKVVKELQINNFHNIHLSMIFGDKDEDLKYKFLELNASLDTTPVTRHFMPVGRGLDNVKTFSSENTKIPLSIQNRLNEVIKEGEKITPCACSSIKSLIFINYDGIIYPCPSLIKDEYKIGNVFDVDLVNKIKENDFYNIEGYKNLKKIYPYNYVKCKDCDINIFCWNCPATLDLIKGDEVEFDRWCKMMKLKLKKAVWEKDVDKNEVYNIGDI